ncbi:hypothetical protein HX017_10735 [Myroides marinus]|uniref:hypothetical protein n=1 Tax=Myroides marinus TaxID=703342 RepID=UPI0025753BB2|nr:hypothetical protein [Myroides marinus]MDM1347551.1 hypothetical protein [Myroides marinus]MDM1350797.1 hypothetical protein [Myroides marinus]MDM1355280.1 hypothetical protein [Myroides marinus]MDM1358004.1 hypothetical protein [Myroides marinus]MDM1363250.1 hypothetical protein [Myroides marinus]
MKDIVSTLLAIIGTYIALMTFRNMLGQKKLENTYRTLDYIRKHISNEQLQTFVLLFNANNEASSVKFNEFVFSDGTIDTIELMFSEGGCGNGDIHNMIELFSMLSPSLNMLEFKLIWYEYGQIMSKLYDWTHYLSNVETEKTKPFYTEFNHFMEKTEQLRTNLPSKYYTYVG